MANATKALSHRIPAKARAAMSKKPPREILKDIWRRSGLSGIEVAKRAGYATASGFYALTHDTKQGDRPIPHEAIKKLIPVLRGLGSPPITVDELLAISNAAPTVQSVSTGMSSMVSEAADRIALAQETGGALLPIRYRAEKGTYIDKGQPARNYGTSRIALSVEFPLVVQMAAVVSDDHAADMFKRGTHLHIVQVTAFTSASLVGRPVLATTGQRGELAEVIVCRVHRLEDDGTLSLVGLDGRDVSGSVVGVIIGAYVRF